MMIFPCVRNSENCYTAVMDANSLAHNAKPRTERFYKNESISYAKKLAERNQTAKLLTAEMSDGIHFEAFPVQEGAPEAVRSMEYRTGYLMVDEDATITITGGEKLFSGIRLYVLGASAFPLARFSQDEKRAFMPHNDVTGITVVFAPDDASIDGKMLMDGQTQIVINTVFTPSYGSDAVNMKNYTMGNNTRCITTSALIQTSVRELTLDGAVKFWQGLLSGMDIYREYGSVIASNGLIGNMRDKVLLFRAVTQTALIYAAKELTDIPWTDAVKVLNTFNWSEDNPEWLNVLVISGPDGSRYSIKGRKQPMNAGHIISEKVRERIRQ